MSSTGILLPDAPRLLIIRLGAMGDVIHTLPAAGLLRRALPRAEITWAVEPRWAPLLDSNPAVDHVVEVPLRAWRQRMFASETRAALRALRDDLRARSFHATIDFQGLLKSAVLGRMSKAQIHVGFERKELRESLAASFYTHQVAVNRRHVVDKNLALARALSGASGQIQAIPHLPQGVRAPSLPVEDYLLAAPLAGWKAKQWPRDRYAQLAALAWSQRRLPMVLDGAPADRDYLESIAAKAPAGACRVHVSTLPELIGATRAARLVLGVDSGPLHLAAALRKPGVALFGPTDPARNGPYGDTFKTLRRSSAKTTYKRSDRYSESMTAFSAEEVWAELSALLDERPQALGVLSGGS